MAKITGRLIYAYPTQELTSKKNGNAFRKRDFVIAVQRFDPDTGDSEIDEDNTPLLSLTGEKCSQLDNINVGEIVSVTFFLRGRRYRDTDNKERIITDVNVTNVSRRGATAPVSAPQPAAPQAPATTQQPIQQPQPQPLQQPANDDLPF